MLNRSPMENSSIPPLREDQLSTSSDPTENPEDSVESPFAPAASMSGSVIGTDLTILGEKITIISQKSLQIDGDIRSDVAGKQITIGPEGSVIGTISSETVDVHGGVRGAIRAKSVALHPTAQVNGEIIHQTITIAEGAQFEGTVVRPKNGVELTPNLDANSYESALSKTAKVGNGSAVKPLQSQSGQAQERK